MFELQQQQSKNAVKAGEGLLVPASLVPVISISIIMLSALAAAQIA